jgi:hypothetical protein
MNSKCQRMKTVSQLMALAIMGSALLSSGASAQEKPIRPDEAKANWLPAPKSPFYMVLREYSPGPAVLNGGWLPPKIEKAK